MTFQAFVVNETEQGSFKGEVEVRELEQLPEHDVVIKVSYSSLNYKDALSATGNKGVTRQYPHVPGIDAVGEVISDKSEAFRPGDKVIVTGYDFGMNTDGGYSEYIAVPAEWVVRLPEGLSEQDAMILGTAGLTAGLSVQKLLKAGRLQVTDGEVLVTGATGGVGTIACMLLVKLGFQVVAVTGKADQGEYLLSLGVTRVISRSELAETPRPMLKETWAAVVDTVGGETLNSALKMLKRNGSVTTCGMVAGAGFSASVFPFILRGVNLLGVDSVEIDLEQKTEIWRLFASDWHLEGLTKIAHEFDLAALPAKVDEILAGRFVGRGLVKL